MSSVKSLPTAPATQFFQPAQWLAGDIAESNTGGLSIGFSSSSPVPVAPF
jgi:hypothetical protein